MLQDDNANKAFFEAEEFQALLARLPKVLRPVAETAYMMGCCVIRSELLTRQWRDIDFVAGWMRL